MNDKPPSKTEEILKLDYDEKDKIWLSDQDSLRILIGVLGILLPLLLMLFLYIDTSHKSPLESISHYYFTRVSSVFVIIISLLAIFLLLYKGKEHVDFYVSSAAGIFALCVALFPTNNISSICPDPDNNYSVTILKESELRYNLHYLSAAVFLSCLAFMSLFLFTKSDKPLRQRSSHKKIRNKIYRICGVMMIVALAIIFSGYMGIIQDDFYRRYNLTFWMEVVALESFGISWLVKAEVILKDHA